MEELEERKKVGYMASNLNYFIGNLQEGKNTNQVLNL
jgi:hypothetical protein